MAFDSRKLFIGPSSPGRLVERSALALLMNRRGGSDQKIGRAFTSPEEGASGRLHEPDSKIIGAGSAVKKAARENLATLKGLPLVIGYRVWLIRLAYTAFIASIGTRDTRTAKNSSIWRTQLAMPTGLFSRG